jgi:hypothetical protein
MGPACDSRDRTACAAGVLGEHVGVAAHDNTVFECDAVEHSPRIAFSRRVREPDAHLLADGGGLCGRARLPRLRQPVMALMSSALMSASARFVANEHLGTLFLRVQGSS